jgi:hypothetical protein
MEVTSNTRGRGKAETMITIMEVYQDKVESFKILTGLANEEEEPHAAGDVEQQGHGVPRVAEQIDDAEEGAVELRAPPRVPDGGLVEPGAWGRGVSAGGAADEGRGKAPGEADEDKGKDIVEDGRVVGRSTVAFGGTGVDDVGHVERDSEERVVCEVACK